MSWKSIIGQERLKELFKTTITQKRLAPVYMFSGPPGVGKSAFAIELAKALQCERQNSEACEECSSCKKFQILQHPNLFLIFSLPVGKNEEKGDSPTEKLSPEDITNIRKQIQLKAQNPYHNINVPRANFIKINSIRDVRKSSALRAFSSGIKVFILINAEEMNDEASNALLKTLEEPHEDSMFVLTTSYPERLLPTIVSRCQCVRFDYLSEKQIAEALCTQRGLDPKQAAVIARRANGNYSLALEIADRGGDQAQFSPADFLRTILYYKQRKDLAALIDELSANNDRATLERYLVDLQTWLQDGLLLKEGKNSVINIEDEEVLRRFVSRHDSIHFRSVFRALDKTISLLNKNVYIPLLLINLAIDLRTSVLAKSTSPKNV